MPNFIFLQTDHISQYLWSPSVQAQRRERLLCRAHFSNLSPHARPPSHWGAYSATHPLSLSSFNFNLFSSPFSVTMFSVSLTQNTCHHQQPFREGLAPATVCTLFHFTANMQLYFIISSSFFTPYSMLRMNNIEKIH